MDFSANLSFAVPEIILAVSAMVLLVWGAFQGKSNPVFQIAAIASLIAAAVAAAWAPQGSAFGARCGWPRMTG